MGQGQGHLTWWVHRWTPYLGQSRELWGDFARKVNQRINGQGGQFRSCFRSCLGRGRWNTACLTLMFSLPWSCWRTNCWLCSGGSYFYCSSYLVFSYQSFYNQSSWEHATTTWYLLPDYWRTDGKSDRCPMWSMLLEETKKHHSFCRHSLGYSKKIHSKCFEYDSKDYLVSLTHKLINYRIIEP